MYKQDFFISKKQFGLLEGLSYWIADIQYINERFGSDEPEIEVARKTVSSIFDELDGIGVPFFIQNHAIAFGDDWRQYKCNYLVDYLKERRIFVKG